MDILQIIVHYKIALTHFTQARYQHQKTGLLNAASIIFLPVGILSRQSLIS